MARIQTLVSTMNRSNADFLKELNVETDVIVGNQNNQQGIDEYEVNGHRVKFVCSDKKGLSRNRNLTLQYSDADICLLADDDIDYCKGYAEIVEKSFDKYKDADIIIFNLHEDPVERYVIKKPHTVKGLEFLRYGSVRIAFKRKSVIDRVSFDERFGAGGEIPLGEDTIFLGDCLKKRLKIVAVPDYILSLKPSESSWFNGYDGDYFLNKGKMFFRIFGDMSWIICLQDAIRHKNSYSTYGAWTKVFHQMANGVKYFKAFHM